MHKNGGDELDTLKSSVTLGSSATVAASYEGNEGEGDEMEGEGSDDVEATIAPVLDLLPDS